MTSSPSIIQDYARREFICSLSTLEHAGGKAVAGLVVEAHLEAIAIYLRGSVGTEAAYAVLQRHADSVVGPLPPRAARATR